jgi:tyrosyl-tRNA synthetase
MTALVHGAPAAVAAAEAADLLFSGDPTSASEEAFTMLAEEIPSSRLSAAELADPIAVFVGAGLASSNGDARRSAAQRSFYANGVQLDEKSQLSDQKLVHGKYLLLRKGKKSHHLLEIFS